MTLNPPRLQKARAREILVVIALTVVGASLRLWSLGRLGLIHFDEGIYALAGLWMFSPRGLAGLDPAVIAYAPPGFPLLVGLSYLVLGVGDVAAILVSLVAGILAVPLVGWLARRTFGPGAGGAAAAFAAFSGPHVAFSRMALTDISFLLVWLGAIAIGQRFLERPRPARAVLLGLAVGCSQLFKYNGWISGIIVVMSALVWLFFHREEWRPASRGATWGWGSLAAIVATAVYWPWFQFVDSHGGYRALLAHQRSYLGAPSSWPGHLSLQLAQARVLSGGPGWLICGGLAAVVAMLSIEGDLGAGRREPARFVLEAVGLTALALLTGWGILAGWIFYLVFTKMRNATKSMIVLGVGWTLLAVLTPFYHPYARLWLPLQSFNWLFLGATFAWVRSQIEVAGRGARWTRKDLLPGFAAVCVLGAALPALSSDSPWKIPYPRLLAPSDSLREASRSILSELPEDVGDLHVFARPPLAYYLALAGRVGVHRQPDLAHLLDKSDQRSWAVLDVALTRQSNVSDRDLERAIAGWSLVRRISTTLNPPTLLDIDPAAARGGMMDFSAPIWLLRPRRMEDAR